MNAFTNPGAAIESHFLEHAGICFWKGEISILFVELKDILDLI